MRNEGATGLATLLALADSRLPIGGHVHSGGVEEAVASGLLRDAASVEVYLRRRIATTGLVTASLAAAVCAGTLAPDRADLETDARTPSPAARAASRAQGRGLLRLAKQLWPNPVEARSSGRTAMVGDDSRSAHHSDPTDLLDAGTLGSGDSFGGRPGESAYSNWAAVGPRPHLPTVFGMVGLACGADPRELAGVVVYTTLTGAATAAQRLLALDPAAIAASTLRLAPLCDRVAAEAATGLAALSDPLQDALAERHLHRDMPLFAS
ncbi:urease accessory protein UreF [Nocardia coubleae]|uniref:Urease accessory protein UreF n=1 Tax=Nocardia coubleae TaxID=356147 RepID=A0A846W948_9NOCA|nr:urease accessory UreF family protein [Nocardia coubleae]NKX89932.1 urease accessory protein UreF [Nocardia coubleae]